MESTTENTVEKITWLEPATKILVTLVEECSSKVGKSIKFSTKKKMWEYIAKVMDENHGYHYSPLQVENKFKSLGRKYKNKIHHYKNNGNDIASCLFEKELDNVFKNKDNILPQYLLGTQQDGIIRQQFQEKSGIQIDEEVRQADEFVETVLNDVVVIENRPVDKNKKAPKQSIVRELRSLRNDKNIYYKKKLDLKKKQLFAYKARTKEMEKKNMLLAELIKTLGQK